MLIELPNGDWIDPYSVDGVRLTDDKEYGPKVMIDAYDQVALFFFHFDDIDAARGWMKKFGEECNSAMRASAIL